MPRFLPEPPHRHGNAASTAVVLVNLGTPDAPTAPALRRYLKQFLSDPRVVEIPKPIWWLILNGIILNIRPKKSAAKYASVWMPEGSPLRVHTERQAKLLKGLIGQRGHHVTVTWDDACNWLTKIRNQPEMRFTRNFHDHDGYIGALEQTVRKHWQTNGALGENDRLLISFHGLPKRSLTLGDPYFCECHRTGRLLAERLNLKPEQFQICFQSRFGKAEWLQPYTAPTLEEWGKKGIRRVDIICPGFVADCLETLEEIAQEGRDDFLKAGGKEYHYIPALNENDDWTKTLADIVESHLAGWPTKTAVDPKALETSARQAIKFGARS